MKLLAFEDVLFARFCRMCGHAHERTHAIQDLTACIASIRKRALERVTQAFLRWRDVPAGCIIELCLPGFSLLQNPSGVRMSSCTYSVVSYLFFFLEFSI